MCTLEWDKKVNDLVECYITTLKIRLGMILWLSKLKIKIKKLNSLFLKGSQCLASCHLLATRWDFSKFVMIKNIRLNFGGLIVLAIVLIFPAPFNCISKQHGHHPKQSLLSKKLLLIKLRLRKLLIRRSLHLKLPRKYLQNESLKAKKLLSLNM